MEKTRWLKKTSVALLLSTSLILSGQSVFAATSSSPASTVVQEAYELVGKPYKSNGNSPAGFDSAGFVAYVLKQAGVSVNDTISSLKIAGTSVPKNQIQPGDVLIFKSSSQYVGIYVGNDKFLYASRSKGKVVEQSLSIAYKSLQDVRRIAGSAAAAKPVQNTTKTDADATALGQKIIATGEKFLGVPYKFGAEYETSRRFDCSSFTQYVYKLNGIKLPREARPQSQVGKRISRSELRPGDLVFFSTKATMKYPADSVKRIGHVGIYAGNNRVLHTYGAGGVKYSRMDKGWWNDHYVTAVRVIQ